MEDPKSSDSNAPAESHGTMSTSPESSQTSDKPLNSSVTDGSRSVPLQQETNSSLTKLEQDVPDASLEGRTPELENAHASVQQEAMVVQQSLLGENIDNHHQGVGVDNSESSFSEVPNSSSAKQNIPSITENLKISIDDGDTVVFSSEDPAKMHHSSEIVKQEVEGIPQQLEDDSSAIARFSGNKISNPSASIDTTKTEETPSVQPVQINHRKDMQKSTPEPAKPVKQTKQFDPNRAIIDTAAPFESVKEVVTKFGGIVDWKAHRASTLERQKHIQSELERVRKEIPEYKQQSEAAEKVKAQVVRELESTKRTIEELKLNLERAQTEEIQAKQDSELAQLRVKEMEQGIAGESSIAAKAQLEVAKARYEAAIAELKSVKEELSVLQGQYASLLKERDMAVRKAEEAVSASKEIEKTVEELTLELITTKETLELAHAAHLEAEEHRIGAALAREQDCLTWEKELKQAEEEVERLNQQLLVSKELKSKLDTATTLLLNLKTELAAYMETVLNQESEGAKEEITSDDPEEDKTIQSSTKILASTRKELEEVKANIDKAKEEVNILKVAASSLKLEVEREKSALSNLQQREGMASIAVSSLEAELDRTKQELEVVRVKEKEARDKMVELPKLLQQAAQEADEAKSVAQLAKEELHKAKEEAEQVKAGATTTEIRLRAAWKEIEAAQASERLALAAIKALEESEQAAIVGGEDLPDGVTLSLEEYYVLSKKAHDAEELAHERVETAMLEVEVAKEAEMKCLERLEEAYKEMEVRKEALRVATEKADRAKEGKLGMEQELRKWRAESEQRRRNSDATKSAVNPAGSPTRIFEQSVESKSFKKEETDVLVYPVAKDTSEEHSPENDLPGSKVARRRKKSLIPRIVMFLAKRKQQSTR